MFLLSKDLQTLIHTSVRVKTFFKTMTLAKSLEYTRQRIKLLKVLGFVPITVVNGKSVTKPFDIICFLLALLFGLFFVYLGVTSQESLSSSDSKIAKYGNFIMFIASVCVSMTSMCFSFIFRHEIWSMVVVLAAVEEKVKEV